MIQEHLGKEIVFQFIFKQIGVWYLVLGLGACTWCLVPDIWYLVPGTRYLVPGTRFQVLTTNELVSSIWYKVLGPSSSLCWREKLLLEVVWVANTRVMSFHVHSNKLRLPLQPWPQVSLGSPHETHGGEGI